MPRLAVPSFLLTIASGKNAALLAVLFLSFALGIMPALEADIKALSGGVGVMDLLPFYTPEKVSGMLQAYGPEGRELYLAAQWTADLIYPLISASLFSVLLVWLGAGRWWWTAPLLAIFDWTENVAITVLLLQFPAFHEPVAWISCFFTSAKWAAIAVIFLIVLFHAGKRIFRRPSAASPLEAGR